MKKSLFLVLALLVLSCSGGQKKAEQEEQARLEQKKEQAIEAKETRLDKEVIATILEAKYRAEAIDEKLGNFYEYQSSYEGSYLTAFYKSRERNIYFFEPDCNA